MSNVTGIETCWAYIFVCVDCTDFFVCVDCTDFMQVQNIHCCGTVTDFQQTSVVSQMQLASFCTCDLTFHSFLHG